MPSSLSWQIIPSFVQTTEARCVSWDESIAGENYDAVVYFLGGK